MTIESLKNTYPIKALCRYFSCSRAAYYRWCNKGKPMHKCWNKDLAQKIKTIFYEHQKGYRYITFQLKRLYQMSVNSKTVLRYMQIMGLQSPIRKKRFISCTKQEVNEKARIAHYNVLARNFKAHRPLFKLVTDVSYIYHKEGRLYLSVIKDLYDNSILAHTISKFNDNQLVFDNLAAVFNQNWDTTNICMLHSDQGYQYTNLAYVKQLDALGITISHSRKANCYDNACCENFFSHLKSESLELFVPANEEELIQSVNQYIYWYNSHRPQEKLKGMTPIEFRNSYL